MFKRKGDAPEYNYMYGVSGATMIGGVLVAH